MVLCKLCLSRFLSFQLYVHRTARENRHIHRLCSWEWELEGEARTGSQRETYRDVFEEVDRVVINVVADEIVVCYGQECHLRNGENIHELFYLWPLCPENTFNYAK